MICPCSLHIQRFISALCVTRSSPWCRSCFCNTVLYHAQIPSTTVCRLCYIFLYYRNAEMMPLFIKCLGHLTEKDYFTKRNLAPSYKALFILVRCGNASKIAHFPTWHIILGPLCRHRVVPIMAPPCILQT